MSMSFDFFFCFSFENSPRHDSYVPKFEAELAQFCEKLVRHACHFYYFFPLESILLYTKVGIGYR